MEIRSTSDSSFKEKLSRNGESTIFLAVLAIIDEILIFG
jgi:hypothetical protein